MLFCILPGMHLFSIDGGQSSTLFNTEARLGMHSRAPSFAPALKRFDDWLPSIGKRCIVATLGLRPFNAATTLLQRWYSVLSTVAQRCNNSGTTVAQRCNNVSTTVAQRRHNVAVTVVQRCHNDGITLPQRWYNVVKTVV